MIHRTTLPALGLGFLLAMSAWGQHHSVVGNDYDDGPGGGDPNPSSGCAGVQAKVTISGGGISFSPATVTIDPGQPVCWTWSGGSEHTVKGDDGSFTSGPPSTSGTFQRTFNAPGTYGYYCQVHGTTSSGMRGTVVVRGNAGGSGAGTLALLSNSYAADEGVGALTVTVTRTGGSDGAASVKYETASGTAKTKKDFTARTGTLNWAAGDQDSKTIEVPIKNDKAREKNETFTVKLSKATGAGLGTNSATVTINDDDSPGCGSSLAAPAQLQARGQSDSEIHLTWADPSAAGELRVERRQPGGAFQEIATLAAGVESFTDSGLPGGATFQYRVRALGIDGASAVSRIAAAVTDGSTAACDDANALCLDNGRFEATVEGQGPSADPQLLLDLRDGCGINGHRWLYFATVADVELTVTVRDTRTGRTWAWFNPAGSVPVPVRDVEAFSCSE
ncbi:MAG TPA: Calx-beta domain-containing protein [Thermoanaerobaculia bacterium]